MEYAKKESKLQYMEMEGSGAAMKEPQAAKCIAIADLIIPEVELPSSDDDDFTKVKGIPLRTRLSF